MPFNGQGVFNRIYQWVNDASNNLFVDATRTDTDSNDIADGLTNCITRDGQSTVLANLPMGGFKLTGLGPGQNPGDSVNFLQAFTAPAFTGGATVAGGLGVTGGLTATGAITFLNATSVTGPTPPLTDNNNSLVTSFWVNQKQFGTALPAQTGNAGKFITTDGANASWQLPIPAQAGNANKVLGTNGTVASWRSPLPTLIKFTSSGSWVATSDTARLTLVGGGGSSSANSSNTNSGGAGGGTGIVTLRNLTVGATYTITIGAGALAVSGLNAGNSGGTTSFSGPGITTVTATGGGPGNFGVNSGPGGVATNCDISIPGGTSDSAIGNGPAYSPGGGTFLSAGAPAGSSGSGFGAGGGATNSGTGTAGAPGVVLIEV